MPDGVAPVFLRRHVGSAKQRERQRRRASHRASSVYRSSRPRRRRRSSSSSLLSSSSSSSSFHVSSAVPRALGTVARALLPRGATGEGLFSGDERGGGGREAEEESRESATTELNRPTVVYGVCCFVGSSARRYRAPAPSTNRGQIRRRRSDKIVYASVPWTRASVCDRQFSTLIVRQRLPRGPCREAPVYRNLLRAPVSRSCSPLPLHEGTVAKLVVDRIGSRYVYMCAS